MAHTVMTFVTRVKPERVDELRALLKEIGDDPEHNAHLPFRDLNSLHFSSLVLHDSAEQKSYGPRLVFENNFDGPLGSFLDELHRVAAPGLHQIYSCCEGGEFQAEDGQGLLAYLRRHVVRPNAYHIGNTGRSVERVIQEHSLRDALETNADTLVKNPSQSSAQQFREQLQSFVRSRAEFKGLREVGPRQTFLEIVVPWLKISLIAGILLLAIFIRLPWSLLLAPLLAFILAAYLVVLRRKEATDYVSSGTANPDNVRQLVDKEDRTHSVQNHMASITIVKPGWFRRATLWGVLFVVNVLARARATHGELSGIPSIHFAHWSLIDGGHRLLFLSNFDGSWENYLDDFIDKAHAGLTAVWSNTVGFPRTQFLIQGGATDGPRFKAVARNSQTVTDAWYSAYRDLTVQGIDNNSSIREQLFSPLSEKATLAWLRRL